VGCLFSGGKDSTYSLYLAKQMGLSIECLLTLIPHSDESYLFHFPNTWITSIQSQALQIPIITIKIQSSSIDEEDKSLDNLIKIAIKDYQIEGIVHGGISSNFQKKKFYGICKKHRLKLISPIWQVNQYEYMTKLLTNNFLIKIVGISAMGLELKWLGTNLNFTNLRILNDLSNRYGFNLSFEGGEGETLVLDCPIFKKKLEIRKSNPIWDGQRGILEISDIILIDK
jgi:ABC transporter with metal-binding/Fe-S-binding domain ATP-binding protein